MATIKGKWVFNDAITLRGPLHKEIVNFISYGDVNYTGFEEEVITLIYSADVGLDYVYFSDTGWEDEAFRTVDFGETEQTVSDEFYTWFTANAVQEQTEPETPAESEPEPTDTVTIEYNGAVIASLKAGQSASLPCKDKPMRTDVVVTVPEGMGSGEAVEEWDRSYTITSNS